MTYTFRPAKRENTPLIIGIAGATKSGKTLSALRMATGIAAGGPVLMINTEGERGNQYADKFSYLSADLRPPYRPTAYREAFKAALAVKPAVIIIDSASHMHDGPGGILEWHDEEVDRMLGDRKNDYKARERMTMAGWVKPKADENAFVYEMNAAPCAVILCLRAKEKIKVVAGKPPLDLGWQPIVGDRVAFETIITLMLLPHSKGVPDLSISDMREPFDAMIKPGCQIDEALGRDLAAWARGAPPASVAPSSANSPPSDGATSLAAGEAAAAAGLHALMDWWKSLPKPQQVALMPERERLKGLAAMVTSLPIKLGE